MAQLDLNLGPVLNLRCGVGGVLKYLKKKIKSPPPNKPVLLISSVLRYETLLSFRLTNSYIGR